MSPVAVPFIAGVVVAPLVKGVVKPIARGVVKTSVGLTMDVKEASRKARKEVRSAAAEAASRHSVDTTAEPVVDAVPDSPEAKARSTSSKS